MHILVINSGSTSVKFSVFETSGPQPGDDPQCRFDGELSGIGEPRTVLRVKDADGNAAEKISDDLNVQTIEEAMGAIFEVACSPEIPLIEAVGYRVVHPGSKLNQHQRVTPEVLNDLEGAADFAPLHDPAAVAVIRKGMLKFPNAQHFACFDTVFHGSMPEAAFTYPIPAAFRELGVRRYGFHGLSCESIVKSMRAGNSKLPRRMTIAHLGSGCSVTALIDGCSIDTSMGLTPTGGVVMGTRPGDLDPGVLLFLLRQGGQGKDAIGMLESALNHESGLIAIAGLPNDMKVIRKAAADGDTGALMALKVFTRSITKMIGGFCWLMGGLDAVVFTGGIGEHDAYTRSTVLADLEELGISLNSGLNESGDQKLRRISSSESKVSVFVVPAQEDLMIAIHVSRMAQATS